MRHLAFGLVVLALFSGCASAPPNLGQKAKVAWENSRYQGQMDVVRNTAIEVSAIPVTVVKPVVTWHRSSIIILHQRSDGWKASIITGLNEVQMNLPPAQKQQWGQYFDAVRVVLEFVMREEAPTDESVIAAYEKAYEASKKVDDDWLAGHP